MASQLVARQLSRRYPDGKGLLPIDLDLEQGEMVAIVGHNGAGKSTLLKLLASWLVPDSGTVTVEGVPIADRVGMARKLGFVPETPNLYELFSVDYNFALFARLFGCPVARIEETLLEFGLVPFRRNMVRTLSKGLKQRVSMGRALLADPPIFLLDEPTAALDFEMTAEVYRLMHRIHAAGKTIIFTSHRPEEVRALATRILVLHQGSLVFDGTLDAYFQSEHHRKLYG